MNRMISLDIACSDDKLLGVWMGGWENFQNGKSLSKKLKSSYLSVGQCVRERFDTSESTIV